VGGDGGRCEPSRRIAAVQARVGRPRIDGVEQPSELEVGQRERVRQRAGELRDAVFDAGQPSD